ncbi:MAG: DNA polymerase II [Myxococcales bacterium]|nr:DNA polymerase II [Myxococcales bacterium]
MPLGLILHSSYRIRDGRPIVRLVGRLEHDVAFLVEDDRFRPYFFVARDEAGLLAGAPGVELHETDLCDMAGRKVVEVVAQLPGDVPPLRESLERNGGRALEADIRFAYRYLIDRGIRAGVSIEGRAEAVRPGLVAFRNPELKPADCRPPLRTLSIDLETSPDASEIYSIALAGRDVAEVHLVARAPVPGARIHPDERHLLAAAGDRIRELDPDILTGWNVVDFDLRTWVRRARALGLTARLGRVDGAVSFQQDPGFTRQTRADVPGRMVLDGIALVRDALRLEDYRLETVARAVLDRGKLLDPDAPDAAAEITRLYREDPAALAAYNLEDARLVIDILEREGLLDLTLERSLLSGMQLDRVGASIASFDLVYLPELRRRGVVAPSVASERKTARVRGGALLEPQPGIFPNVAVFDFKSLYPSLIRTFNLDPLAHARGADAEAAIEAPGGARFARGDAILPAVIERFMERREDAKRRGDRHADQAIKIMMNALFGVLGAGSCRFFDPDVANAITGFGQQTLRWTREAFEDESVRVLYGDTDSVFVQLEAGARPEAARAQAERLRERVERRIDERVRAEYRVEPRLELVFERLFERFFLPRVRGGKSGSKKRYAGWADGRLVIVGLESVRRDWPAVARRLQQGMLTRLFRDEDVPSFVRNLVTGVAAGDFDAELVYAKRIRKGSVERYTATTPPHIQAARKAGGKVGPVVRYVITQSGPEPVLPGRPLPEAIDRSHYLERVLRPVADAILPQVDSSFDEAVGQPHQLPLL